AALFGPGASNPRAMLAATPSQPAGESGGSPPLRFLETDEPSLEPPTPAPSGRTDLLSEFAAAGAADAIDVRELLSKNPAVTNPGFTDVPKRRPAVRPPAPPPTPANGSPSDSLEDIVAKARPVIPKAAPRKEDTTAGDRSKSKTKPPFAEASASSPAVTAPPAEAPPSRPEGPGFFQRTPVVALAFGFVGALLAVLGGLGWLVGSGRLDLGPLSRLLRKAPQVQVLEQRLWSGSRRDLESLVAEIERMPESERTLPEVASLRARATLRLGELVQGPRERWVTSADQILRILPKDRSEHPSVQLAWAELEIARGDFEAARKRAEALSSSTVPRIPLEARFVKGLADLREGRNFGAAIESLGAAVLGLPDNTVVRMALAETLLRVSNYKEARDQAEKAVAFSPESSGAWRLKARACAALADLPCAELAWSKAAAADPQDSEAALGEGEFHWQDKKDGPAAAARLKKIAENPAWADQTRARARAYFLLGEIATAGGKPEEAQGYYEKVRAIDSAYPGLASRAGSLAASAAGKGQQSANPKAEGKAALRKGQFRAAIRWLEQAVEKDAKDGEVLADLGLAYLQIDQTDKARRSFEKALSLDPENVTALRWLGQIYSTTERKAEAVQMFKKFLKLAPKHPDAPLVQALLKRIEKK
ncbi:MAG: tetratricopeptide repeat protein, partial [Bdellovibrionota bacterium]